MSESASASIAVTNSTYQITLTDTGDTPIGTFWFSWVPGEGFLPDIPAFVSPAGWSGQITDGPLPSNGYSILWTADVPAAALQPGQSLAGFTFQSTVTPAVLFAPSTIHPPTPVATATVYSAGIFSDAGFMFAATQAPPALTITASSDFRGQSLSDAGITFAAAADAEAIFSSTQFGPAGLSPSAAITGDGNADRIAIAVAFDPSPSSTHTFSAAGFTFTNWTDGFDSVALIADASPSTLIGTSRNDQLYGSDGDDVLKGGAGLNQLWGGAGNDTASYTGEAAALVVDLRAGTTYAGSAGAVLRDQLNSIENIDLSGATAANTVIGNDDGNVVRGGPGTTIVYGLSGDDTFVSAGTNEQFWGGDGSDTLSLANHSLALYADLRSQSAYVDGTTPAERVLLVQTDSVENLVGGIAGDTLVGDGSVNVLTGGRGADRLWSMGGADTFAYATFGDSTVAGGYDTIGDFQTGIDRLDLRALHIGTSQIVIQSDGVSTSLYAEHTAGTFDPAADLAISFVGANAIAIGDVDLGLLGGSRK
jgi:Ca2+-binding RTX toxin-like protein